MGVTDLKWHEIKTAFLPVLSMSHDMAHIHLGLATFLILAALLYKRRGGLAIAWLIVLTAAVGNEAFDAVDWTRWTGSINFREAVKDTLNTVLWPTIIWGICAWRSGRRRIMPPVATDN